MRAVVVVLALASECIANGGCVSSDGPEGASHVSEGTGLFKNYPDEDCNCGYYRPVAGQFDTIQFECNDNEYTFYVGRPSYIGVRDLVVLEAQHHDESLPVGTAEIETHTEIDDPRNPTLVKYVPLIIYRAVIPEGAQAHDVDTQMFITLPASELRDARFYCSDNLGGQ